MLKKRYLWFWLLLTTIILILTTQWVSWRTVPQEPALSVRDIYGDITAYEESEEGLIIVVEDSGLKRRCHIIDGYTQGLEGLGDTIENREIGLSVWVISEYDMHQFPGKDGLWPIMAIHPWS